MNDYVYEHTHRYEGIYTPEEIELNKRLYEECNKRVIDFPAVEELLKKGADPLGPSNCTGLDILEHLYGELVSYPDEEESVNLPKLTELFLKYGMDISSPRIPYDGENSLNPLWSFAFIPNENAAASLKLLLDHGLDADSAGEFWDHAIFDLVNITPDDPNEEFHNNWTVWTFKMIMLLAAYDHILDNDNGLRDLIGYSCNSYDVHKFKNWNDFRYEFDTLNCESFPELYKSIIHIYELKTGEEVWKIRM